MEVVEVAAEEAVAEVAAAAAEDTGVPDEDDGGTNVDTR